MRCNIHAIEYFWELNWLEQEMLEWYDDMTEDKFGNRDIYEWFPKKFAEVVFDADYNTMAVPQFSFKMHQKDIDKGLYLGFERWFRKFITPTPLFMNGFNQGMAGGDLVYPKNLKQDKVVLLEMAFRLGQEKGEKALTYGFEKE